MLLGLSLSISSLRSGTSVLAQLASIIDVSRASTAWAKDSAGTIHEFAAGVPRITDRGLLVHEAVTYAEADTEAFPPALTSGTVAADNIKLTDEARLEMVDLGPELVTNGGFDTDSDWSYPSSTWSISEGKAHVNGQGGVSQSFVPETGSVYLVEMDVSDHVTGGVYIGFLGGTNTFTPSLKQNGKITAVLAGKSGNILLYIGADSSPELSIDNISVRKLIPKPITLVMEFDTPADWEERSIMVLTGDTNHRLLYTNTSTKALYSWDGSIQTFHGALEPSTRYRIALSIEDGQLRSSVNGGAVVTGSTDLFDIALDDILLGSNGAAGYFLNSHIHDLKVIKGTDTDAKLIQRSTL